MKTDLNIIPIVIFHINGNQEYFKKCINISSYNNIVYLIGDNFNSNTFIDNNNIKFIHINTLYSFDINEFKKYFINYSTNSYDYELNCFLRVFYLKNFLEKTGYKKVFHTDSDCVIFDNINSIITDNIDIAYSIQKNINNIHHMVGSIHNSLLNLYFCNKFIELCFDIYKNKSKYYLIEPKITWHKKNNSGGGICDMTLYYLIYSEKIINNITDLNDILYINNENIIFDHQLSNSYGFNGINTYKIINGIKELIKNNNKYYFITTNNELIRTFSIHFQGDSKKYLLNEFDFLIKEKSIFLPNRGVHNIYHFLIYMIYNLRHINFIPDNIYLDLSNEYFLTNHNFAIEILLLLYPKSKIINTKECPHDCLSVPQDPGPINRESGVNKEAYTYLKKIFLQYIINNKFNKKYSKYIYISREDSNYRKIINEDVLFCYLEKKGFEKIVMSKLTLLEQMSIFYNASIVISIHGAQLTNILFCNENVKIIEIVSKKMSNLLHYEDISKTFNLNYNRYESVIETKTDSYDSDLVVLNIESFEKYLNIDNTNNVNTNKGMKIVKISLCIPTKNRFDNFLNNYLDKYVKYLEDELIDELIISDEDGNDYNKIINKYQNILQKNNNFKVYKNNEILGVFLNKLKVCSYANNNYIALIDSDNFCEESYFITVKNYILSNSNLSTNLVLAPSYSKPCFSYKSLENIILTKDNINQYKEYENFNILINTGNYIITKNIIDNIKYDNTILHNISACDVEYFNLLIFKQFKDFQFHVLKDLEYYHIVHDDSEYSKTINKCYLYATKYIYNEIYNLNKYVIFKPSGRLGNALFRYFASILFCIKYNYEYILEEECPKIKDYIFYHNLDHMDDDIERVNSNIDNLKNICNNNENALCFNTVGYIKSEFNLDNLNFINYVNNNTNNQGLYVKNIIKINDNNYFKHYNNCKINNLIMDGYFQFDKIYLEHKNEIINFIEKNKNNHKIKTDRNEFFLMKDLIENIKLDDSKIYDIVIHLRLDDFEGLDDFIEYKSIILLLKKIILDNKNKRYALVFQKVHTDKNIDYITNLLNWFKQNNIEINIESNDLITDFNIMKQCKTLICSNSTLSWTAAYLSKNIELCYMPSNKNHPKRFKKPIENTIFYNTSNKKNCYICGYVLNCEKYLKNVFNNIVKIGELFDNYKIIIEYYQSNDNSLNILYELKKKFENVCQFEIIINNNKIVETNSENISNARNSIIDFIRNNNNNDNDDYEYFIMMNFNDVYEKEINTNTLKNHLNNNLDSLLFNQKDYYNILENIDIVKLNNDYLKNNKYLIFRKLGRFGSAIFRYFASALLCIKYDLEYILEDECPEIEDYIFYEGVDHINDDIQYESSYNIDIMKNICKNNDKALCFNTIGFIKSDFNINKLSSNSYINKQNKNGLYVKNIININDDNFFNYYENNKINNLIMDGYFQFDNIYLDNKDIILEFIEKNKNNHYITIDRNDKILIKDIIDNILLPVDKIYDIVIHIRLGDYIEYKYLEELLNNNISMFTNKKIAIVSEKINLEKDIEYLDKILNFFKSHNNKYSVSVETNNLITDFNIMKQCKVLICSMSRLSWCAAYLSKNIKLCIMPNYNFYNDTIRKKFFFKKPTINTIFYNTQYTKFNDLKIIILTLKNFNERSNIINNLLINMSMIGITHEIVYGIYGKDIKVYDTEDKNIKLLYHNFETYYYDKTKRLNKHIMKAGELGCAWSHLNIYKKLCSDKLYNKYLIFEDDACLSEKLDIIYNTLNNLPNIFDICHISLSDWYPFNKTDKENNYFYNIEKKFFNRTTSYIISKEGALKLLKYSNNYINIPSDDLVCNSFINNDDFKLYVPQNYLFKENIDNISIREKIDNI